MYAVTQRKLLALSCVFAVGIIANNEEYGRKLPYSKLRKYAEMYLVRLRITKKPSVRLVGPGPTVKLVSPRIISSNYNKSVLYSITQDSGFVPFYFTLTNLGEGHIVTKTAPGITDNERIVLRSK